MTNWIMDDYGKGVIAVGAPGSIERVKVQYPKLISQLNSLYFQSFDAPGRAIDEAIQLMRNAGITSTLETNNILDCSEYKNEKEGTVTNIVKSV